MNKQLPTYEEVSARYAYDPITGHITHKVTNTMRTAGKRTGYAHYKGYRSLTFFNVTHKEHRIAWLLHYGSWPIGIIDHINGIRHDNRIANLREVSAVQNAQHWLHRKKGKTGYHGVTARKDKFRAMIHVNGKTICLGTFADPELASEAYKNARRKLHFS